MVQMNEQPEGFRLTNMSLDELLVPAFRNKLKALGLNAISLVLIYDNMDTAKTQRQVFPLILNHQSSDELKKKILHLQCHNPQVLTKVLKLMKEVDNASHKHA